MYIFCTVKTPAKIVTQRSEVILATARPPATERSPATESKPATAGTKATKRGRPQYQGGQLQ